MSATYLVFSQRAEVRLDEAELKRHAAQFFATRLGFAESAEGRVAIVVGADEGSGVRVVEGAARTEGDQTAADGAEARAGGGGLAGLARRCPTVWRVACERDDDRVALRVAAILAGALLGPIVAPDGAIFGPKTAREKLASR